MTTNIDLFKQVHARIARLESAFIALAVAGGLPKGFAKAFKDDYQAQMVGVAVESFREGYDEVMGPWLDFFEEIEKQ